MTLKRKLIVSFIGFIVIPLIILGYFSIKLYSSEIHNTVIKTAVQSNEQIIKNIDALLETMIRLSEYPVKDKDIMAMLAKNYEKSAVPDFERNRDSESIKYRLYNNIKTISDMIDSVFLYNAGSNEIAGKIASDTIIMDYKPDKEEWAERIMKKNGGHAIIGVHRDYQQRAGKQYVISVGRSIVDIEKRSSLGFIVINVLVDSLEKLWMDTKLTENSKFYLVDERNNVIFSKDKAQIEHSIYEILGVETEFSNSSYKLIDYMGDKHYLIYSKSKLSDWKAVTVVPEKELLSYLIQMLNITLLITSIIIALSVLMAILIATSVTKPLYRLNKKMKLVGKGNFNIEIESATGEVGEISKTVQIMIEEIKRLINKIYCEEEEKRIAEMLALQAQINPHFLYNTLNTIKWMANMQGTESIENALNSLSAIFTFTARVKGDYITVEEEIKFIKDYIAILTLRYYNRFTVSYEIDEKLYGYKTLKFILQPVVENAIIHGIEGSERKGCIKISVYMKEGKVYFIVKDNGVGISNEKLETILEACSDRARGRLNSIGVANIQKRLKLFFGNEYGIDIQSGEYEGTTVTIVIPAIPGKDDKRG